jgi:UDPglucose--hexose-1-phosphate uridylyltransferase
MKSASEHSRTRRCLFCDIRQQERDSKVRMVFEDDQFAAFAPHASRSPYELSLLPIAHQADFTEITDEAVMQLSGMLSKVLKSLKSHLNDPPYNLIIHSCPKPIAGSVTDLFHWHFEIIPRLSKLAGFEWGTGFFINSTFPEEAATNLRSIIL